LYLNAVYTQRGMAVSPHLVAIRGTYGTVGYIATPAFARQVLAAARIPTRNTWIDLHFKVRMPSAVITAALQGSPAMKGL
jgi:hypothetical protein